MEVYRIAFAKRARTLNASGMAARWNSNGVFIIYSASSISLACLENSVHRNRTDLLDNYRLMIISIPGNLKSVKLKVSDLPVGWNGFNRDAYSKCRAIGDKWAASKSSLTLVVPSVIIRNENNILINAAHPDFSKVKLKGIEPFSFDPRIKQ